MFISISKCKDTRRAVLYICYPLKGLHCHHYNDLLQWHLTLTSLQHERPRKRLSIPGTRNKFFSSPKPRVWFWGPTKNFIQWETGQFILG